MMMHDDDDDDDDDEEEEEEDDDDEELHWGTRGSRLEDDHSSMPADHVSRTITTHSPGPF